MAAQVRRRRVRTQRGVLAHPLDALAFLLPLILFYEWVAAAGPDQLIAFRLLRRFLDLFGPLGPWAPGLAVITILLATHAVSGEKWVVHWREVGFMYVEAAGMALPLLVLNWVIPLSATSVPPDGFVQRLAVGIGAGIYEELVFRLVLITVLIIVGVNFFKLEEGPVAVAAVCISSLAFAAHHHRPFTAEQFSVLPFLFRTAAGCYLAIVFWYRGYGPAAGCHAAYNAILVVMGAR